MPTIQPCVGIDAALPLRHRELHTYSAAQRFSWAALRQTTRIEDRAYSLLSISAVNIPLLCGEGSRASDRLQEEIIQTTQDLSILVWSGRLHKNSSPPLASSLSSFADCEDNLLNLDLYDDLFNNAETIVSPRSLRLTVKLVNTTNIEYPLGHGLETGIAAILNFRHAEDDTRVLGLK